ncbi:hypothetical protein [Allonocardiopsis opalescens]|uniref:Uncharacterized protein n=1 Tax=Allonocardiopsis opalescens TaxID=1144618 RepID=A0A2T0PTH6_9ACTN|nr:hypothetical protein [Allonocardiopsis opalescens]PRX92026.1 hypothetical protein CLV72_11299 [Allonocardiopsis opalescens]
MQQFTLPSERVLVTRLPDLAIYAVPATSHTTVRILHSDTGRDTALVPVAQYPRFLTPEVVAAAQTAYTRQAVAA